MASHQQLDHDHDSRSRTRSERISHAGCAPVRAAGASAAPYEDALRRDFTAKEPDRVWLADMTQHPTREGWLYLAVVLDVFARRVVGWSMSERATSELVVDAVAMAVTRREPLVPVVHHSDRGAQYTSVRFTKHLHDLGLVGSMGRAGTPGDNAMMESFFSSLQSDVLDTRTWRMRDELRSAHFVYLEITYNRKRRHSSLNYLTPEAFEAQARATMPTVHKNG